MSNGTHKSKWHMCQALKSISANFVTVQFVPAGLSLPVPAHRERSCSTRSPTMNLARSNALHSAPKPRPASCRMSGLRQ